MTNPAALLLHQLRKWRKPTATAASARGPTADLWLEHRTAIKHLEAIEQLLSVMAEDGRNTSVYRRYLPSWYAAVFAHPKGWEASGSGNIDERALAHLENLADALKEYVPVAQPEALADLRQYSDLVATTLVADSSLPKSLRLHALEVVGHLKWCINQYDVVGDFDLEEALERLAGDAVASRPIQQRGKPREVE